MKYDVVQDARRPHGLVLAAAVLLSGVLWSLPLPAQELDGPAGSSGRKSSGTGQGDRAGRSDFPGGNGSGNQTAIRAQDGRGSGRSQGDVSTGASPGATGVSDSADASSLKAGQPWIVAVLPPDVGGERVGPMNSFFATELRKGLTQAGQMVVSEERISSFVLRHPLWSQCRDAACLDTFLKALRAEFLVQLTVEVLGKNFDFSAEIIEPGGKVRLRRQARCDICTLKEARATARKLGLALGRDLGHRKPPTPKPECVTDADCGLQRTCRRGKCLDAPRPRPRPECNVAKDCGAHGMCRRGKCVAGPRPRPPTTVVHPKPRIRLWERSHPWGQFALVTGAVALTFLVAGSTLAAIDGRPTCSRANPKVTCPERYDTLGAGIGFLVFSGISAAAGGFFTYLWWRRRAAKQRRKVTGLVVPFRDGNRRVGLAASVRWEY